MASSGRVVTGVPPKGPETGYGYVGRCGHPRCAHSARPRRLQREARRGDRTELPRRGRLSWNSGMFMVRRSVWLAAIERWRPDIAASCRAAVAGARAEGQFIHLDRVAFSACPSESIDYAVMEHVGDASSDLEGVVVPLDAGWSDVGAWEAVWATSPKDEQGNVVRGNVVLEDTRDSLVQAESRLRRYSGWRTSVAETADAVLVARKDATADLKRSGGQVARTRRGASRLSTDASTGPGDGTNRSTGSALPGQAAGGHPGAKMSLNTTSVGPSTGWSHGMPR
jgi:mannose-1-phosphate guanylyltransferase/mannose-6-phosphate isomerase